MSTGCTAQTRSRCLARHVGAERGTRAPRHDPCGGSRASTSSITGGLTGSTSLPLGRTLLSRPGVAHLPGPGEYYASPALTALLRLRANRTSSRNRYPGHQIGGTRARRVAVTELPNHRHRPLRAPALACTGCSRGGSDPAHSGQLLQLPIIPTEVVPSWSGYWPSARSHSCCQC